MQAPRCSVVVVSVWALCLAAVSGCSVVLETDTNPHRCVIDADCARFTNAVCDNVRKMCTPKLPIVQPDAGSPDTGGETDSGTLTCELSFDNGIRIPAGPDGGLRPLPEAGP
jgi:hypothetical protein